MNGKHLWWIIPLCFIIFGGIGYVKGVSDGWNAVVDECNSQYEYSNMLCDIECELQEIVFDTMEYYEKRCPNVVLDISTMGNDEMLAELQKYGIR